MARERVAGRGAFAELNGMTADSPRRPARGRRRWIIGLAVVVIVGGAALGFAVLWRGSGAHEASTQDARRRFRQSSSSAPSGATTFRPPAGVYRYRGEGTERLSLPPKSQH